MSRIISALAKHKVRPKHRLGQNFLTDETALARIADAADLTADDTVLEIGAGIGNLSALLAARCGRLIALEKDRSLEPLLRESLLEFPSAEILFEDILQCSLATLLRDNTRIIVVGNLPFYITSPIIAHLLAQKSRIRRMVFTVQYEVAQRIVAEPGSKRFGRLSCLSRYHCMPEFVLTIPRQSFHPRPEVNAGLIRLTVSDRPAVAVDSESKFFSLIQAAFTHRRKIILNSIMLNAEWGTDRVAWEQIFRRCGIAPESRAEQLSLQDFADLLTAWEQHFRENGRETTG